VIRRASECDTKDILSIYSERLINPKEFDVEEYEYFKNLPLTRSWPFELWVSESEKQLIERALLGPMRNSSAVRNTMAELSVYVKKSNSSLGTGFRLTKHALAFAQATPIEWVFAFIGKNIAASRIFCHCGGRLLGELPPVCKLQSRDSTQMYACSVESRLPSTNPSQYKHFGKLNLCHPIAFRAQERIGCNAIPSVACSLIRELDLPVPSYGEKLIE
jgi:L-amino acid N-acyltransferase YncA